MEINGPWAAAGFKQAGINLGIAQVPVGPGGPVTLASIGADDGRQEQQAPGSGDGVPGLVDRQDRADHVRQRVRLPAGAHRHGRRPRDQRDRGTVRRRRCRTRSFTYRA